MRTKELFNGGWRFHEGDIKINQPPTPKHPTYMQAKAESAQWGPANRFYVDCNSWVPYGTTVCSEYWKDVRLPHDYVVDQVPTPDGNEGPGFMVSKNSWYRKTFRLSESDKNKRITIYFEGITNCCTIWVNSCLVKRNFTGYVPFEVDITDYALFGDEQNVIAVYIDTSKNEGWWYEGGGIYRNAWLIKTDLVSVDTWGVYVAPKKLSETEWEVPIETTVRNDDFANHRIAVKNEILDEQGNVVAEITSNVNVARMKKVTLNQKVKVTNPNLWSCETPNLYYCKTSIIRGKTVVDESQVHFGFRTIRFDPDHGFFLNDKHVIIKGVCCHEDFGLQGKAVFDRIKRYRIKLFKEMGANGYRTSHYSHSDQTMDELDRQGFLVMSETRWFGTSDEYIDQLVTLIKKDRNRPGVIMWSLFNEERMALTEQGKRFVERNSCIIRELDPTRPVTSSSDANPEKVKCFEAQDIVGINYNLAGYDALHEKFPKLPIFSSENCALPSTRGWYNDSDLKSQYFSAFDYYDNKNQPGREGTWKFLMEREWVAGGYQWAAIEHRGECQWPRLCSVSGAIDLFLQRKDAFYQNQSFWSEKPMVHILPHWNLKGRKGEEVTVWTYTNCEQVELFLNGKSLGKKDIEKYGHGEWKVVYTPGEVVAKGYIGGKEVALDRIVTTGEPVALELEMQTEALFATPYDAVLINCYCVDANGNRVPDAKVNVSLECNGLGTVRSTGSDYCDHVSLSSNKREMRAGVVAALIVSTGKEGTLKVYAHSKGLESARLEIPVTQPNDKIR